MFFLLQIETSTSASVTMRPPRFSQCVTHASSTSSISPVFFPTTNLV